MSPSIPEPKPMPAPPTYADASVTLAGQRQRTAARRAAGSTIMTSSQGDRSIAPTANKTLLGQ